MRYVFGPHYYEFEVREGSILVGICCGKVFLHHGSVGDAPMCERHGPARYKLVRMHVKGHLVHSHAPVDEGGRHKLA